MLCGAAAANCVLILAGLLVVPATVGSLDGVGIVVADLGLQVVIVAIGWLGPLSLGRLGDSSGWCLAVAGVFAAVYVGHVLLDFGGIRCRSTRTSSSRRPR